MLPPRQLALLKHMLSLPTAPFAEHHVIDAILRFCRARAHLSVTRDSAGNILARYAHGGRRIRRPVCLTAHLDHPGFVVESAKADGAVRATWRGGVRPEFFADARVRFHHDAAWVRGRVSSIRTAVSGGIRRVQSAQIALDRRVSLAAGAIGMWDFPDPAVRGTRIFARGCDDVAGASALLCCIDELARRRVATEAYFLFTRAEEVGFIGAIAACRLGTIPRRCLVVAVETSSALPHARLGDGPILRVGDKATTFTPAATAYVRRVADRLARRDPSFKYQRRLMDGGTCESSAFCEFGYTATGLCVALGNYHNMNLRRRRLGPEYIDLRDFAGMVRWFVELARAREPFDGADPALRANLRRLEAAHADLLSRTRDGHLAGARPIHSTLL